MPVWCAPQLKVWCEAMNPILVLNTGSGLKDVRAAHAGRRRSADHRADLIGGEKDFMRSEWSLSARYFMLALIIAFLVFVGYQIRELFRPLIFAGVIAYLFYPLVAFTQRRFKLKRKTASRYCLFCQLGGDDLFTHHPCAYPVAACHGFG